MYFFKSKEKQEQLLAILKSWEGTPYRHKTCVKNRGVDCINFVGAVMVEVGLIKKFHVPDYAPDWHLHRCSEMLSQGIEDYGCVEKFNPSNTELMNGDILLFQYGRASSHSTIYFAKYIWQAIGYDEVRRNALSQVKDRLTIGFRAKII